MKKFLRLICIIAVCACLAGAVGCAATYDEFLEFYQPTSGTVPQDVYHVEIMDSLNYIRSYQQYRDAVQEAIESPDLLGQWALVCFTKESSIHYYPYDIEKAVQRAEENNYDWRPFTWTEIKITRVLEQSSTWEDFDELEAGDIVTLAEAYSFEPDGTFYLGADVWGTPIWRTGVEYVAFISRTGEKINAGCPSAPPGIFCSSYFISCLDENTISATTEEQLYSLAKQDPRYFFADTAVAFDMLQLYRENQ